MPNPYIIYGIIAGLILSLLGGFAVGWHERVLREPALILAQQTADKQACAANQRITKGANDALQKNRDAIARKLAALKLQHPSACVSVTGQAQLSASGGEHAGQNGAGVNADWLRDYAAEAEGYRSQFIVCNETLDQERQ